MLYTTAITRAIRFSTKTHEVYQKQKRKGKDIPYITHPLMVGLILALAGATEEVIVAGILHDTIEDSTKEKKVTSEMLTERFGSNVAGLVQSVTELHHDAPWEQRKQDAVDHIREFSHESVLVKAADVLANGRETLDDFGRDGNVIFERFKAPEPKMQNVIMNYSRVIDALQERWPENTLAEDLDDLKKRLQEIL